MKATTFRAAAVAFTLCVVAPAAANAPAKSAERDTANGVVPVKPAAAPLTGDTGAASRGERASAAEPGPAPEPVPAKPQPAPIATVPPAALGDAQRYCDNIAAVAAEARFAWQTRKLNELQGQVASRIAELEKKQAELEASLGRRDEAMRKAQGMLVTVYAKMDPEAAAAQLALLEDGLAAAILAQLTPKQSSLILNEIKPERASQLVAAMTSLPPPDAKADGRKS